jgi:hypothetical protein
MRNITSASALLLALLVAGCNGELVGGGAREVNAVATGDGTTSGSPSGAVAPRAALVPGGAASFQSAGISGTVSFTARVELVRGSSSVALHPNPASTTVRTDGRDTMYVAEREVPRERYGMARVTFTSVTANVSSGLRIGGASLTGRVDVGIPAGGGVVVEMPVDLGGANDDATLLIDLDASAWFAATDPVTRIVPASAFQSAVKLRRL